MRVNFAPPAFVVSGHFFDKFLVLFGDVLFLQWVIVNVKQLPLFRIRVLYVKEIGVERFFVLVGPSVRFAGVAGADFLPAVLHPV